MNIRLVKQKINNINYDYDTLYNKIEEIMRDDNIIDLGEKKISIFGLFDISIDFIPDIIERKTVISVIIGIFEELKFMEISKNNIRLKLDINPIYNNTIRDNIKTKSSNDMLLNFVKDLYNESIEKNLKNFEFDDKIFAYVALLMISILEDSSIILLEHQISLECIPLETGLEESKSDNILIDKILNSIKKV